VVLDSSGRKQLAAKGLTDSKALSPRRRAALVPLIQQQAQAWALGQASAREIDDLGIRTATELAMLRALQRLAGPQPDLVLVDGVLPLRLWSGEQRCIVRGDAQHQEIAAASVLAKQARDALIQRLAQQHPGYGLERHAGYGTALHRAAVLAHGPTALHRRSFLRKLLAAAALSEGCG
jgi:ribonuclease HII